MLDLPALWQIYSGLKELLGYSVLRAVVGAIRVALYAGIQQAMSPTTANITVTAPKDIQSKEGTPYNSPLINRERARETISPSTNPMPASLAPFEST